MRSMTLILYSAFLLLLTATGLPGADIQHVVFDSHARTREKFSTEYVPTLMHEFPVSEHKWPLRDLNPDLPSDWSPDRKSTRLNSSHLGISYAVFCLKKKT